MPSPPPIVHRVAAPEDLGERADVVLGRRIPGLSRRVARAMALAGDLLIDGRPAPPSTRVRAGMELVLRPRPGPSTLKPATDADPPVILRTSADLVYVLKPAGLASHRLRPDEPPALADRVAERFPECRAASEDPREAGLLHRLDHLTSGVVALARTRDAWVAGRRAFAEGRVGKHYAAIGHRRPADLAADSGNERDFAHLLTVEAPAAPPADLAADLATHGLTTPPTLPLSAIDLPLGHGQGRGLVAVRDDGAPASTLLQILAERGERRLFLLRLISGRRHQARVHLAAIGWPIVGDPIYDGAPAPRLCLHAWRLDLGRTFADERPVVAPLPDALLRALDPDLDPAP